MVWPCYRTWVSQPVLVCVSQGSLYAYSTRADQTHELGKVDQADGEDGEERLGVQAWGRLIGRVAVL